MILETRCHRHPDHLMRAMQATNSHEFRRRPPGSLFVSAFRVDGDHVSVTIEPAPVVQYIDGGKIVTVHVCERVDFTSIFRGFRDRTSANRKEAKRRKRCFNRWQEELRREIKAGRA